MALPNFKGTGRYNTLSLKEEENWKYLVSTVILNTEYNLNNV
jgi:hypothetical protein